MHLQQAPHQREPDAQAAGARTVGALHLREHLEDALQLVRRNADAAVLDRHAHLRTLALHRELDRAARPRVLAAVVQQVAEHLRQARRIGFDIDRFVGQRHAQGVLSGLGQRPRCFQRLLQHRGQLDRLRAQFEPVVRDAVQVEQVVDQSHQLRQLALHRVARTLHQGAIVAGAFHHRERVAQRRQRVAQLVRQRGQELVLAPIRLGEAVGQAAQLGLGLALPRDVARHLRRADHLAGRRS